MSQSFAEMFEESLANQDLRRGAVVTGTVVDIQSDSVIVNAGLKSEGVIPIEEFSTPAKITRMPSTASKQNVA